MGIAMTLEDSWGGDITTAAIAHLAHSTPEEFRFTSTDFNSYVTVSTADGAPQREQRIYESRHRSGIGHHPETRNPRPPRGRCVLIAENSTLSNRKCHGVAVSVRI